MLAVGCMTAAALCCSLHDITAEAHSWIAQAACLQGLC